MIADVDQRKADVPYWRDCSLIATHRAHFSIGGYIEDKIKGGRIQQEYWEDRCDS